MSNRSNKKSKNLTISVRLSYRSAGSRPEHQGLSTAAAMVPVGLRPLRTGDLYGLERREGDG